jgi:hypothetical protein
MANHSLFEPCFLPSKFLSCPVQYLSDMRERLFARTYQTLCGDFGAFGAKVLDTPNKSVLRAWSVATVMRVDMTKRLVPAR